MYNTMKSWYGQNTILNRFRIFHLNGFLHGKLVNELHGFHIIKRQMHSIRRSCSIYTWIERTTQKKQIAYKSTAYCVRYCFDFNRLCEPRASKKKYINKRMNSVWYFSITITLSLFCSHLQEIRNNSSRLFPFPKPSVTASLSVPSHVANKIEWKWKKTEGMKKQRNGSFTKGVNVYELKCSKEALNKSNH